MNGMRYLAGAVLMCVGTVHAQLQTQLNEPKLFMWGEAVAWNPAEPLIVRVVQPHLLYQLARANGTVVTADPQLNPRKVAEWAAHEIVDAGIPAGKVCIVLRGFGEESTAIDGGSGQWPTNSPTRFFRPEDWLSNIPNPAPAAMLAPDQDGRSDRGYKHPCLINGGTVPDPGNPGQFVAAPLKA